MRILHQHAPRALHPLHTPARIAQQDDVARRRLDRKIFIQGRDLNAFRLHNHRKERRIRNRAAIRDRNRPRTTPRLHAPLHAVAQQIRAITAAARFDALAQQAKHLFELVARKIAIRIAPAASRQRAHLLPMARLRRRQRSAASTHRAACRESPAGPVPRCAWPAPAPPTPSGRRASSQTTAPSESRPASALRGLPAASPPQSRAANSPGTPGRCCQYRCPVPAKPSPPAAESPPPSAFAPPPAAACARGCRDAPRHSLRRCARASAKASRSAILRVFTKTSVDRCSIASSASRSNTESQIAFVATEPSSSSGISMARSITRRRPTCTMATSRASRSAQKFRHQLDRVLRCRKPDPQRSFVAAP